MCHVIVSVKPYDNIPILSFLFLLGKCRKCKARIPIIHPFIEALTGLVFWLSYTWFFEYSIHYAVFSVIFLLILISLTFIDLFHMILPDELTYGGAVLFLIYSFFNPRISVLESFGAAFGGALFFASLYFFYLKVRKIDGLGFGDVKMMLFLGAFLGVAKTVVAVMLASFFGTNCWSVFYCFLWKDIEVCTSFRHISRDRQFCFIFLGRKSAFFYKIVISRINWEGSIL